jgi:hypothetical protein
MFNIATSWTEKNRPSAKQRPLHQQKILTSTLLPIIGIGRAFQNLVGRNAMLMTLRQSPWKILLEQAGR